MRYRLLGPITVLGDTGPVRPGGRKLTSVLAALLLNPNRVVSEDRLIDLTWGENAPPSVRGRLQVHISELRKLLGRDVVVRRAPGYVLEVAPGDRDLDVFDEEVAKARATTGPAAVAHLRAALALWDGTPLGGASEELTEREGPALAERRLVVLEELYEQELASGRHGEVVGELRQLVEEHPFRERLRAALMLALHRCGRSREALETYTRAHDLLVDELGIEPGQALQDLRMRILRGEGEPAPAAIPVAPPRPAELPLDVRGFAGRAPELATLDEPGDVWVITGTAGVGKTALAVHWAHTARERYPDGQLYVNLRGFDADDEPLTPAAALAQLLRTLGVDLRDVPPGVDDQSKLYRSLLADRQALVVLDNARDTAQVLPLLPSSGRVLVTSRHRLDELVARTGARLLGLAQLREEDSRELLTALLGDRTAAEPQASAELARLCGHHPLALRIAAANTGVASIGELVDELRGDPLAQLGFGFDGESAVAKAFSVSYQALPPVLRHAFRLLALVPGADFTAVAAATLLEVPAEEAARRLRGLIAANLLEAHAPRRYRFHDLARRYAEQRVLAEEDETTRDAAWERLFTGYCAAADAAVALLGARIVALPREDAPSAPSPIVFGDAAEAVAWLDVEVPNLSAALRQAAARGPFPGAWYLADALRRFFHDHGRRAEWLELAPIVLDAAQERGAQPAEALVHLSIGGAYFREGQHEAGIRHSEKAVLASRACGWRQCEATAVANLGAMLEWTGRLAEAVEHSRRAIQLFRELANRSGEALALNSLSCHYRQLGRLEQAEDCLVEAIALARKEDLAFWEAANLADLGWVLLATGRQTDAEDVLDQALRAFRDLGSSFGEAIALNAVSALRNARGDHASAVSTAETALACVRRDGDRQVEAGVLIGLGRAYEGLGDLGAAERVLREARDLTAESGLRGLLAEASATLARVLAAGGRAGEAGEHARTALDAARAGGFRVLEAEALLGLAAVEAAAGRSMLAGGTARESRALYHAVGHVTGEAFAERFLAGLDDRATG